MCGRPVKYVSRFASVTFNIGIKIFNVRIFILKDLVEKVMVLRKAVEMAQGRAHQIAPGVLADKMSEYAGLLAGQGSLYTAMSYLGSSNEVKFSVYLCPTYF